MADATWDIVVGVRNKAEIDALNAAIEQGEQKILAYADALNKGTINSARFEAASRSVARSIEAASARVKELEAANAGMAGGGGNAARGLLQVAYAADDVQYGFRGIVNNIPQIVLGLGMGAGVAGAAAIAAVAVNQLINHWGELIQVFDGGATLREAEAMKELAEATKVATEHAEKLAAMKTGPGKMAEEATDKAIVNVGERSLEQGIALALRRERPLKDKLTVDRPVQGAFGHADNIKSEYGPGTPEYAAYANAENEKVLAEARAMAGDVSKNNETRMAVMGMTRDHPDAFSGDAMKKLAEASPEAQADKRVADALVKALNKQGEEIEAETKREHQKNKEKEREKERDEKEEEQVNKNELRKDRERRWAAKEDEIDNLQDKKKAIEEKAREEGRHKSQIFSGGKAFADATMTSALDATAKDQLKEARELNKKIDALRADLKQDRRQARLG